MWKLEEGKGGTDHWTMAFLSQETKGNKDHRPQENSKFK